ncbi:hypothetical protein ACP70R_010887 [Stipagrostis hirtigluma subsp. patula]
MEATCIHLLYLFVSVFLLSLTPFAAGVTDTLGKGGNITGDETLVSANGTFTMGFFSLGAPTKRYYLGIWFSVSIDAVCWVANRERPLNDSAGMLMISDTGGLVLLDSSRQIAWSSNSTTTSSSVEAKLHDDGNFVVRDNGSSTIVLWQSFDHPSNTLLSGMKVGKDSWTGSDWYLTSWSSPDDPSPGAYRRILDTAGLPDFVVWEGDAKTYRAGPWNGLRFSGDPEVSTYTNLFTFQVTTAPDETSYGFTAKRGAPWSRLVLTEIGGVQRLVWDGSSRSWQTFFRGPRDVCDRYNKCGPFGLCDLAAVSTFFCRCVKGFSPASPAAWSLRDTSGGCRRDVALQCSNGATTDGFVLVKGVKLPDTHNASVDMSITVKECRRRCRTNCSCLAYAAADIRGGHGGSGCVIWTDDLIDLRYVDQGQDLYLRLAKTELDKDFPIAAVVAPVASTVVVLVLFLFIWWRRKHNAPDRILEIPGTHEISARRVPSFDLPTIINATRDFSDTRVLGQGGFAIVYRGELLDGRMIAAKRLKQSALTNEGKKYFERELDVMATLTHSNLLSLLAYCNEGNEHILIYPYMPNLSLDYYIFEPKPGERDRRDVLNWRKRLDIIHGIAQGVDYLHKGSGKTIVHRDLKPSNVLLDDNWNPKIADFNTAKLFTSDQPESNMTIVVSPGYACPEYALQGDMTLKCDVYSFGVLVLEILSGRMNGHSRRLISCTRELWEQNRAMALLDPVVTLPLSLPDSEISSELERCIKIGLLCVQEAPDDRPDMSAVLVMLTSRNSNIILPRAAQQSEAASHEAGRSPEL